MLLFLNMREMLIQPVLNVKLRGVLKKNPQACHLIIKKTISRSLGVLFFEIRVAPQGQLDSEMKDQYRIFRIKAATEIHRHFF